MALNLDFSSISQGINDALGNISGIDTSNSNKSGSFLTNLFNTLGPVLGGLERKDVMEDTARQATQDILSGLQQNQYTTYLEPYQTAGTQALERQMSLLGLGGDQGAELERIASSPYAQQLISQGEQGILQNAAATGGLRGGNVQRALSEYRPAVLDELFQRELTNLSPIVQRGYGTAKTLAQTETDRLKSIGEALAQGSLAGGAADLGLVNSLIQQFGMGGTLSPEQQAVNAFGQAFGVPGLGGILENSLSFFGGDLDNFGEDTFNFAKDIFTSTTDLITDPVDTISSGIKSIGKAFGF